ncbi:MAG: hypothetical protein ACPG80_00435, partial [Rickettsiales bacterium]
MTDRFTLAGMWGVANKEMEMENRMGMRPRMESDGWSDFQVNGLYELFHNERHRLQLNFGVSLPIGSTEGKQRGRCAFGLSDADRFRHLRFPSRHQL